MPKSKQSSNIKAKIVQTNSKFQIQNIDQYTIQRDIAHSSDDLIAFEELIVSHWEAAKIRGPVHLSNGNEEQLIEIKKIISDNDFVDEMIKMSGFSGLENVLKAFFDNQLNIDWVY